MKKMFCLLAAISFILVSGSCSFIGNPTTSVTVPSNYPDSVVYEIQLSNETYLCSSFSVSSTDTEISLQLIDVYLISSDGKITWIGQNKEVTAVKMGRVSK